VARHRTGDSKKPILLNLNFGTTEMLVKIFSTTCAHLLQIKDMSAEIITKDDLQHFKVELLKDIKLLIGAKENPTNEWLRTKQVRKILDISPNTLQMLGSNVRREG
jgi:hypothetical protein